MALLGLAHVMRQRPTTARAFGDHNFTTKAAQQADGRIIDIGVERFLRTARHQRNPQLLLTLGLKGLRVVIAAYRRDFFRRHLKHRAQACIRHKRLERLRNLCAQKRQTEAHWIGQNLRQDPAQGAVRYGALVVIFDILARMIHEVHVMHTTRASRHTSQTAQTAVHMHHCLLVRHALVFDHILDLVDPPTRAVELISQYLIGWTSRSAKSTMHTVAQNLVSTCSARVFELLRSKIRLHQPVIQSAAASPIHGITHAIAPTAFVRAKPRVVSTRRITARTHSATVPTHASQSIAKVSSPGARSENKAAAVKAATMDPPKTKLICVADRCVSKSIKSGPPKKTVK